MLKPINFKTLHYEAVCLSLPPHFLSTPPSRYSSFSYDSFEETYCLSLEGDGTCRGSRINHNLKQSTEEWRQNFFG